MLHRLCGPPSILGLDTLVVQTPTGGSSEGLDTLVVHAVNDVDQPLGA